jgi:hypothetical protein
MFSSTLVRSDDNPAGTAMAGNDTIGTHVRRHAPRRAASAARHPDWSRLAVIPRRKPALATFSAAVGLAVAVLGFGEPVLAVGSPLGFGSTVTTGVISALNHAESIAVDPDYVLTAVQTDAALIPIPSSVHAQVGGYATHGHGGSGCLVCRIMQRHRHR